MVAIHLDANYIFVEPMRNQTKEEMIRAYKSIINRMRRAGLGIKKHTLDNEALDAFKQYIRQQEMQFELVPPGNHRRNQAERAIQTFKLHFILILAGVDDKFPPFPLVPSPQTNRTHPKSPPPIQGSNKNIRICPRPRPP
jgi:hypothetical protein